MAKKKDDDHPKLKDSQAYYKNISKPVWERINGLVDGEYNEISGYDINFVHHAINELSEVLVDFLRNETDISNIIDKDIAEDAAFANNKLKFKKAMGVMIQIYGQLLIDDCSDQMLKVLGKRLEKEFKTADSCFQKMLTFWPVKH